MNMKSYTKLKAHNILHCRERRTELQQQTNMHRIQSHDGGYTWAASLNLEYLLLITQPFSVKYTQNCPTFVDSMSACMAVNKKLRTQSSKTKVAAVKPS